jgi:hypothetical protein
MNELLTRIAQSRLTLLAWCVGLFILCFTVNVRHNNFPYYYHPDEPGKVEQIIDERWNFHHPMLLLATTKVVASIHSVPLDEQPLVQVGRTVSAAFMALAAVALSLLAYLWRGWLPAIASGLALATHHQLYELSHYLKEDSALLAGISLAFLSSYAYSQRPTIAWALAVGASAAVAISGKYIGAVVLVLGVTALGEFGTARAIPQRTRNCALAGIAFLVVFVAVNWPVFSDLGTFRASFGREVSLVATGQGEVTRSVPHALYWNVFVDNTTPVIWILLGVFIIARWKHRSSMSLLEKMLVIFPFAFALALSFSPKENDRYFLPATAMFTLFAGMAVEESPKFVCWIAELFGAHRPERFSEGRMRGMIITVGLVALISLQLFGWWPTKPGLVQYDVAFQRDDQADLLVWMRNELPQNAVIAADSRVGLPNPKRKKHAERVATIRQQLMVSKQVADMGTLDDLRAKGVTHVAVSESSYGRFFRGDLRAKDDANAKFEQGRAFYEQLFREGYREFERERGTVIYLHPGILIYRIVDAVPAAKSAPKPANG